MPCAVERLGQRHKTVKAKLSGALAFPDHAGHRCEAQLRLPCDGDLAIEVDANIKEFARVIRCLASIAVGLAAVTKMHSEIAREVLPKESLQADRGVILSRVLRESVPAPIHG